MPQFSIMDSQGRTQAHVHANSIGEACRAWANECWDNAIVEDSVLRAEILPLSGQGSYGAHLDPYVVSPAGKEVECMEQDDELFRSNVHFAPEKAHEQVDTGGRG